MTDRMRIHIEALKGTLQGEQREHLEILNEECHILDWQQEDLRDAVIEVLAVHQAMMVFRVAEELWRARSEVRSEAKRRQDDPRIHATELEQHLEAKA